MHTFRCLGFAVILMMMTLGCFAPRSLNQKLARQYQYHKVIEDTSIVYQLPYAANTRHRSIQGYYSRFTHKYKAAIDFKMKKGTEIFAARSGVVIRTKSDSDQGGFNKKYRPDANYVIIQHSDSTRASYRHLRFEGVTVHQGQYVKTGELIGYSGNTGYTSTPHLHFTVSQYIEDQWISIPTRFQTREFTGYIKPLHRYYSINHLMEHDVPAEINVLAN